MVRRPLEGSSRGEGAVLARNVKPLSIAGGKGSVQLLVDGVPIKTYAVDALTADSGVTIPSHRHETSAEMIYVLSGKGTTVINGESLRVAQGDAVYIPKMMEHSLVVDEKITAVQVYAPAGPEQRFKRE